jgi:hypothetical protein
MSPFPAYATDSNASSPGWLKAREHLATCGPDCDHGLDVSSGATFGAGYMGAFPVRVATADNVGLVPRVALRLDGKTLLVPPERALVLADDLAGAACRMDQGVRSHLRELLGESAE